MYDFLGYYSVCYIGDEVKDASRTIPRSIVISVIVVASIYLTMNVSILGVVPWKEAIESPFIASEFMQRIYGRGGGVVMTLLILWTAFASVFALTLGYFGIPFPAARDGFFFAAFARLHPRVSRLSPRLAAGTGAGGGELLHARPGGEGAHHDAHPHPVHRVDRRCSLTEDA